MANTVDISSIEYYVILIDENGKGYDLSRVVTSLQWEEQEKELAQRANITIADFELTQNKRIAEVAKLNRVIVIYSKYGGEQQKLFEGNIWEWSYSTGSRKTLNIIACDPLIRLQQSRDFKYYAAGQTTKNIISDICNSWSIPLEYSWPCVITHEKKIFDGAAVSDMIIELLDEARKKTGLKYVVSYSDGKMRIYGYGSNTIVYKFTGNNTISTSDNISMKNLVTRVKILGTADDEGRSPVASVLEGDTSYGVLQAIVKNNGNKTIAEASAEAEAELEENGSPKEDITVTVPDLPFLRKGDKIQMEAGTLNGFFYAVGVSHNAGDKKMTLTLLPSEKIEKPFYKNFSVSFESSENPDYPTSSEDNEANENKEILPGEIVLFSGGYVYSSPYCSPFSESGGIWHDSGYVRIDKIYIEGKIPYFVIGGAYDNTVKGSCDVYGWVNERDLVKS